MFTTGGGVHCQCGVYNGSNPSLFGETSFGPAFFITRADNLLGVRMFYYACYLPSTCGSLPPTAPLYLYDLMLWKKIVLLF